MAGSTRGPETPLESLDQCLDWCLSGCKPRDQFRIGTEYERILIGPDGQPLRYEGAVGIRTLLDRFSLRHGWRPFLEAGNPIALDRRGASISLEPAGQFELSGAAVPTIAAMRDELRQHMAELRDVAEDLGIRVVYTGHNPLTPVAHAPQMPKGRYGIMRAWMPRVGRYGLNMMHLTCTVQANLDYGSEAEALEMLRLGNLLSPVLIALFANSPWADGRDTGMASFRGHAWTDVDRQRCDTGRLAFARDIALADYVQWLLDVPMYFLTEARPDGSVGYRGMDGVFTFRDFYDRGFEGKRPTLADWEVHVATTFPDVRIKKWVEIRQADLVPPEALAALPALCKGLLYDETARREALVLLGDGDAAIDRAALRAAACQSALDGQASGLNLRELSAAVLATARQGLDRLAQTSGEDGDAASALDVLDAIVAGARPHFWQVQRDILAQGGGLAALAHPW
jgi:glutamate--cysteine ligase